MHIEFWGVRGSIASPGPETASVGGNTSCVAVRCGATEIILDAGTGLRGLGDRRLADSCGAPIEATLLLSHFHWDHIQGLPFFVPAYIPSTKLTIVGAPNGVLSLADTLSHQMRAPVFPVRLDELRAQLTLVEALAGTPFEVGEATVRASKLNHPGGVHAYRIEHGGRSVVYATDTEHYECVDPALLDLARGADVLIYDCQYTPEEYRGEVGPSKVGWGHSTFAAGAELATRAGVGELVLFHHDPRRTDDGVVALEARAQAVFARSTAAREGMRDLAGHTELVASQGCSGSRSSVTMSRREGTIVPRYRVGAHDAMSSRLSLLVDLASRLGQEVEFDALLGAAGERLASALSSERATIWLIDAKSHELVTRVAVLPELPALRQPMGKGIAGYVARTGESVRIDEASKDARFDPSADRVTGFTTRSMLVVPLREDEHAPVRGVVQLLNRCEGTFDEADERYLVALSSQLARALSLTTLRAEDAAVPGVTLRGPFNRIVGRSAELTRVYEQIALAAETDASVLLRGETGTGKGIFARAIHVNSARQRGPFITVDCTTLPAQLVESELFGHERGAFTGADRRIPGRVELAQHGTLFLDEIGDLPLDVQGKLLRFLQERTFERVGGRATLEADVRVVAATHRDLEALVASGTFRQDLYYRVRVVEMTLPSLRARGADEIDALANHFAAMYAKRYRRPLPRLDAATRAALHAHPWPGNVRELEHWVESAVVLSRDGAIPPEYFPARPKALGASATATRDVVTIPSSLTLDDAARRYGEATLAAADGNRTEAARRLGISRNRLSRLLKGGS